MNWSNLNLRGLNKMNINYSDIASLAKLLSIASADANKLLVENEQLQKEIVKLKEQIEQIQKAK